MTATLQPVADALAPEHLDPLIRAALDEDLGGGDVTSNALIPAAMTCRGKVVCRQNGVVCGVSVARRVFELVDPSLRFDAKVADGDPVQADHVLIRLHGSARAVLGAERVALNFLQHLSGIATLTSHYARAVEGTKARILDTRKTTPGLRALEKYATRIGGALNHRMGLFDQVLIKDNHLALVGGVSPALRAARKAYPDDDLIVEVACFQELRTALDDNAPRILLDNFSPGQVREAMGLIRNRALVEVSGGVQASNARAYALAGVDFISVGALTHSAAALDMSLKVTLY
ncbi:MAG: carboxylating nicotinate-nucleotide diphosphorylase [Acidimicrobiales bacterium]